MYSYSYICMYLELTRYHYPCCIPCLDRIDDIHSLGNHNFNCHQCNRKIAIPGPYLTGESEYFPTLLLNLEALGFNYWTTFRPMSPFKS